jgi:DeoR/GlpR family transcriptional regulator of sugar metabolism
LLNCLRSEGKLVASDISARLGVSEDTIRRDLRELATGRKLQRVHGGALPRSPAAAPYAGAPEAIQRG